MGNSNRKNKLRKITVNDEIYYWNVGDGNCDGDGGYRFKIWKDKKVIHHDVIHGMIMTPKIVSDKIKELENNV